MKPLIIKRIKQEPSHCSIAAGAALAHYYNKKISYDKSKYIAKKHLCKNTASGLWSGQVSLLLNYLGFKKVTLVTSDFELFEKNWSKLSRSDLEEKINIFAGDTSIRFNNRPVYHWVHQFMTDTRYENKLHIADNFKTYICNMVDERKPLLLTFNWASYFKRYQSLEENQVFPNDSYTHHAVVIRGYNTRGIFVVDSHYQFYRHHLRKYRKGYYMVTWEELETVIPGGDLHLPDKYDEKAIWD
jgi:hypothetical protein